MAKITRDELAKDEIAEALQEFLSSIRKNFVKLIVGGVLLLVVGGGALGYTIYRNQIKTKTSQTLRAANQLFAQLSTLEEKKRRDEELDRMIAMLQDLINTYPDSDEARLAVYLQGNCYYYKDDLNKAKETFQRFLDKAKTDQEKARARIALGYTLENQFFLASADLRNLQDALTNYTLAEQAAPPGSYLRYYALLNQARVLELTYKDAQALEIYENIMKDRPKPRASLDEENQGEGGGKAGGRSGTQMAVLERMVGEALDPLSIYSTAKLRAERLRATSRLLGPTAKEGDQAIPGAQVPTPGGAS